MSYSTIKPSVVLKHHGLIDSVEGEDRENDKLARGSKKLMASGRSGARCEAFANTITPHRCLAVSLSLHLLSTFHSDSHDISGSHLSAAQQACGTPNAVASAVCPCCRISH